MDILRSFTIQLVKSHYLGTSAYVVENDSINACAYTEQEVMAAIEQQLEEMAIKADIPYKIKQVLIQEGLD